MRTFEDESGARWDVVTGRESWGAIFAIFVPRGRGGRALRQTPLRASGYEEASEELAALDDAGLRELLDRSEPKRL